MTKFFTDGTFCRRSFLPTNWHAFFVENFKIVLFCNNFSCRSKVLGSLGPKSDLCGIQLIQDSDENDSDEENDDFETLAIEEEPGSHEEEKDEGTVETVDFDNIIDIPIVVVDD